MTQELTVCPNAICPVCTAAIDWQQHRLVRAARAGTIDFRDINLEPDALSGFGIGVNDIRRRLHAVDAENRLYAGIDCVIAIWLRTPGDIWLGRLVGPPVIPALAGLAARRVADFF